MIHILYLYDEAIATDLQNSFTYEYTSDATVRVYDGDSIIDLVAQMKEDKISYPIIALQRDSNINIDESRSNFSWMHLGTQCVFDQVSNNYYNEKAIPVSLSYTMDVFTTSVADMDELIRELLFKYTTMYFLSIQIPYESNRRLRFGVTIAKDSTIQRQSGSSQYIQSGQLYRSTITLNCEGCVLLSYTPIKLRRQEYQIDTFKTPLSHN